MGTLDSIVAGYVDSMRPKGEAFRESFSSWLAAGAAPSGLEELIAPVHKFAGSAGSAGFMRLSAVATLIEVGLRGAAAAGVVETFDRAQLALLVDDFAAEIAALSPSRSSLFSGEDAPLYLPFERPLRILLAGLPEAASRILSHVVEQRMGMAWALPDAAGLAAIPAGRSPDLAVAPSAMDGLGFPVAAFVPRRFDDLAAGPFG